jgi:hypothetical protein
VSKRKPAPPRRIVSHPLYGKIPLIPAPGGSGASAVWEYDPDYRPPLPAGAIRGNVRAQDFCPMCHVPKYFYVDEAKQCIQCGASFVFTARQQQFWYEERKANFYSRAVRCQSCRRQRRSDNALRRQLAESTQRIREQPDDPAALVAYAEHTAEHFQRLGQGDLNQAIAATRGAARLAPGLHEALYWNAVCQELAGRPARARAGYQEFVDRARSERRCRALVAQAAARLAAMAPDHPASTSHIVRDPAVQGAEIDALIAAKDTDLD